MGFGLKSNYNYEVVHTFLCWIEMFKTLLIFEWVGMGWGGGSYIHLLKFGYRYMHACMSIDVRCLIQKLQSAKAGISQIVLRLKSKHHPKSIDLSGLIVNHRIVEHNSSVNYIGWLTNKWIIGLM